jgi:hypothetical protein
LLVAFADFPWFRQANIDQLTEIQQPPPDHLYGPQLDIDLSAALIRNPEEFPLVSKSR